MPESRRRSSLEAHAHAVANAVDTAWHGVHGHGRIEVPLSVVAGLALLGPPPGRREHVAHHITHLSENGLAAFMRHLWAEFLCARPDLANPVWPLVRCWLGDHPVTDSALTGAHATARAALNRGQLDLTGDRKTRWEVDLLGVVLTVLTHGTAKQARGLYYTPAPVAYAMAALLGLTEGERVAEPAAGTGGMLRAAAQVMRDHGRDPASATWIANDVDPVAVACLAVNAELWELGPRVLIGVGDTLTDDWMQGACAQRTETLGVAADVRRLAELRNALAQLRRLTDAAAPEARNRDREEPT
ncbi:SAM-dependent methyltransferase [Streptomonospora sp. S1-112]|uniref:site-specific DNA-methyltransferase (adenine-specific) n=1 Tax=Streptomonospora mangrovi TaxID=2883123 RepID=A0A9X3NKU8_9ACTN|nr:N-6 DNA methylase [Streptomonospora mangrovi]MDA0565163.1 SAM-dependent methyltransferase [Streptomonospora mangrovi]